MTLLAWNEKFELGYAEMDDTHREFVDLLNRLGDAADADVLATMDQFIAHTEAHFGQEDRWMDELNFPPRQCHQGEHANVLQIIREVRTRIANGETHYGKTLADALAEWFEHHAGTMDTMLAYYIKNPKVFEQAAAAGEEGCGITCEHAAPAPTETATS